MKDDTRESRSRPYHCVDGRYYTPDNIDLDLEPPKIGEREHVIAIPAEIYWIERWFQDGMNQIYEDMIFPQAPPLQYARIVKEYRCFQHERGFIAADNDWTYHMFCDRFPAARQFPDYGHILYAMRYGNAPVKTYKIGKDR